MDWKQPNVDESGAVTLPKRWLNIRYFEALNILFRTENALRVFVYVVLKTHLADKWTGAALVTLDGKQTSISAAASARAEQARGHGYVGYTVTSPLMHLTSGELTQLIMSDAYWKHFKRYFNGKKETVQFKLEEISVVRNSMAHFRPIKPEDIELIKQNVRHVFSGIESCIEELLSGKLMPSNSPEPWHRAVGDLGNSGCKVRLLESTSGAWVHVRIDFCPPLIQARGDSGRNKYFTICNLLSPNVPKLFPAIARDCVYLTEHVYSTASDTSAECGKILSIIFNRSVLDAKHEEIVAELGKLIMTLAEDVEVVSKDPLARGRLVATAGVTARKVDVGETYYWSVSADHLRLPVGPEDGPEYWGSLTAPEVGDFVSATATYPWMPVEVAEGESWFD